MDLNKDIKDLNFNIDIATLNILYKRYKAFILPVLIIVASLFLFFIIVSPQIQGVLSAKEQQQAEEAKLLTIKNNYSLLLGMNEGELDSDFTLLSSALPATKDFAGVINSISTNAVSSGVTVGDFQFSVGDLSQKPDVILSFPSLQITLSVLGDPTSIFNFIQSLYKSMPLAEITSIEESGNSANLKILFYYKAFPQGSINNDTAIAPISSSDNKLLDTLSSWVKPEEPFSLENPSASSSANENEAASLSGNLNSL